MLGDSTPTKKQVTQLRQELQWERAKNQREKDRQRQALAELEEKVNKTLENQKDIMTARQAVATDLRKARAESLSTTAEVRERLGKLSTEKPQQLRAQDLFTQQEAFRQSQQQTLDKARRARAPSSTSSHGIEEHLLCFECIKGAMGGNGGGNKPPRTTPAGNPGSSSRNIRWDLYKVQEMVGIY